MLRKNYSVIFYFILFLATGLLLSCSSNVKEVNLAEDKAEDSYFSSADLIDISKYMSDSLSNSAFVRDYISSNNEKPLMVLAQSLKNNTDEHIDTRAILQKIRTKMINDGAAKFIDDAAIQQALDSLKAYNTDLFDDKMVVELGKFLKAKYLIRGEITNIRKKDRRVDINYYNVILTCVDMETLEIKWTDEKEMKRLSKRGKMRY